MCWGIPKKSENYLTNYLKSWKLKIILRNSSVILVNDQLTFKDVLRFGVDKNKLELFPYIVDTSFFSFTPYHKREKFILVPGDNDRDEELVKKISTSTPYKIIRVTRDKRNLERYKNDKSSRVDVRYDIRFSELRDLYKSAYIVALPIKSDNHAAGQTSVLEALSCGAPVLISKGRTSSIVNKYDSVLEVPDNKLETWIESVEKMCERVLKNPFLLEKDSNNIDSNHNPKFVSKKLAATLRKIF